MKSKTVVMTREIEMPSVMQACLLAPRPKDFLICLVAWEE